MDPSAFDRLSRALAITPSRRTALAGLSGALTALVSRLTPGAVPDVAAQPKACRPLGKHCFPDRGIGCCRGATCQNGRCRCPKRARRCGNRCLPTSKCCRHNDCPGNQRCTKGRCQCPAGKKRCRQRCIAKSACCRNRECGAQEACVRGACRCVRGMRRCGERCIPADNCCQNSDCAPDQICKDHICVANRCGTGGVCRVFLSSENYPGNLGGLEEADALCQALANASALTQGGTYRAWLSGDSETSAPIHRFTNLDTTGPYVLVDAAGTVIANDWADLTTLKGTDYLRAPINVTETGQALSGRFIWTNTTPGGEWPGGFSASCESWTTSDPAILGKVGRVERADEYWTYAWNESVPCEPTYHLYCFEQG